MAVRQSVLVVGPSATFDLPTQAQNTIVVILSASPTGIGSVTLADNKGNSVVGARKVNYTGGGGISSLTIWVLENITGAGGTHTLSVSGVDQPEFCTLAIAELSLAPGSSYDAAVTATARDTDGSPYTLTTGTPSQDSDLVFGVIASEGSTALDYSASGWTRIRQNADFTTYWGQALFTKTAGTTAESFSATATGGSATQLIAAVGIKQIVFPVVQPFEQKTASLGESVTFSPSYTGSPTSYQWRRNGFIISGATSASYTIPVVSAAENGAVYSVTATNSLGTSVEVGSRLFVRDLNTGKGRAARGWAYQRHQLGIVTPLVVQDRDDWGGAAFGDWFSLAAPSFVPRYMPGGGAFDPSVFDPDVFDAPVVAQQLDPIIQVATLTGAAVNLSLTAAQTLTGIAQSGTLAAVTSVAATQTLGSITQAASLAAPAGLSAAQTLGGISQGATFTAPATATAAQTLGAVSQTGTMTVAAQLSAAQFLAGAIQTATITSAPSLSAAQTLAGIAQMASAVVPANIPGAGGGSGGDPLWDKVQALLHFNGPNNSTDFHDEVDGNTWTVGGGAKISTAQSLFGGASGDFTANDGSKYIELADRPGLRPGTGPYSIEYDWLNQGSGGEWATVFQKGIWNSSGGLTVIADGSRIKVCADATDSGDISHGMSEGNHYRIQVARDESNVCRVFVDGVLKGSFSQPQNINGTSPIQLMKGGGIVDPARGYLDEFRLTIGAARNVAAYTVAADEFPSGMPAAGNQTLGPIVQSATLASVSQVQASQTLGPVSQAATLAAQASVQAAQQLQPVAQAATLGSSMAVSAAQVLAGVTQSAALTLPAVLSASQTLAPVAQAATLQPVLSGAQVSAAQILGGVAQTATITSRMVLQASQTLAPVAQTAALALLARVTAAQTLAPVAQAGQLAAVPTGVVGAQALQPIAQSAALSSSMGLAAAQQLADVIQSATMSVRSTLQAAQVLAPVTQVAALVRPGLSVVSAAQALAGIVQTASLRALASLHADQVLQPITQVGLFLPPYVFRESERVFYVPGENRVFLVAGEDRGFRVEPEDREFKVQPEDRAFIVN